MCSSPNLFLTSPLTWKVKAWFISSPVNLQCVTSAIQSEYMNHQTAFYMLLMECHHRHSLCVIDEGPEFTVCFTGQTKSLKCVRDKE